MGCIKASLPAVCTPRDALAEPFRRDPAPDLGGALALTQQGPPASWALAQGMTHLAEWDPSPAHSVLVQAAPQLDSFSAQTQPASISEAGARPPLQQREDRAERSRLTEGCG